MKELSRKKKDFTTCNACFNLSEKNAGRQTESGKEPQKFTSHFVRLDVAVKIPDPIRCRAAVFSKIRKFSWDAAHYYTFRASLAPCNKVLSHLIRTFTELFPRLIQTAPIGRVKGRSSLLRSIRMYPAAKSLAYLKLDKRRLSSVQKFTDNVMR